MEEPLGAIGNTMNQKGSWEIGSEKDLHLPTMAWMQFPNVVGILPWVKYLDHYLFFSSAKFQRFSIKKIGKKLGFLIYI
jgi:hypothetical protein